MEEKLTEAQEENNGTSQVAEKPKAASKKKSTATSAKKTTSKKSTATTKKASGSAAKKSSAGSAKTAGTKKQTAKKAPAKKPERETAESDVQFASLPETAISFEETEIALDSAELKRIEEDAITALPRAESIDSLLFDAPEELDTHETAEENSSFEHFLVDYKRTIEAALAHNKAPEEEAQPDADVGGEPVIFANETQPADTESPVLEEAETKELTEESDNTLLVEEETEQLAIDFGEISPEEVADISEEAFDKPRKEELKPGKHEEKYDPEKPRRIDGIFELVELFVFTLVAVLIVTTFFFRHSVVDGDSMQNTLQDGEHLIITNFFYEPRRGDIIVFDSHSIGDTKPYIKRVIGVAGDTVRIEADGSVYVNGEKLSENYVYNLKSEQPETFNVKDGELFVMGDHRRISEDSRSFGVIDEDSVLGKVILRFYPFSKFGTVK